MSRSRRPRNVAERAASVPTITYPDLPVSERRDDIMAAIRDNQVVVIAGATGSGKTTQIPKMCLELGRGINGTIAHTQPRRIAARSVAERLAEELGTELGTTVGYRVRFTDRTSSSSLVKVMTDGVLLAEISHDRMLSAYDTIIIDEAHERSLTIDFLLGYLTNLLPQRPDLKLIITSATIDPGRFAAHFNNAPVIEVSGRTYPVDVRYRPIPDDADDPFTSIRDAIDELSHEPDGDVLVFLSGEREIRDAAEALRGMNFRNTEVLPLYGRLSAADQHKIFTRHTGRRIVLATNVAETSLTVPGIRHVIDAGNARISRYSRRLKVQRLPIEPVSRASADQRAGRCGREAPGVCIRLYSQEDFDARPEFTEPEILRTNLAAVLLQMSSLDLGEPSRFPFVDPPDPRDVRDGMNLLGELGAWADGGITAMGRRLARLPVDPRLGRMILEAERNGCINEILIVTAALSIQDPRERPVDKQESADASHSRFIDRDSDFMTYLNLWTYIDEQQTTRSASGFRKMCKTEFLHYLRIREWQDLHGQLVSVVKDMGITLSSSPEGKDVIHQSLLSGLLSHIGMREETRNDYLGARNGRFAIWPGSALARSKASWVMAAELVETSRLWGRDVAKIAPEWIEPLAGDLVTRTYSEPHWSRKSAAVLAFERVTLYGIPIVVQRKVPYAKVDRVVARDLFIRHALVQGEWRTHHAFVRKNQELLEQAQDLEHMTRRRDIVVDDEILFSYFDARVPGTVVSGAHFDSWWKRKRHRSPDFLTLTLDDLIVTDGVDSTEFPREWTTETVSLPVDYLFDPGAANDGSTITVPLDALATLPDDEIGWQVPARRIELVTALIRCLPKALRVNFVPAPDVAADIATTLDDSVGFLSAVSRALTRRSGIPIPDDAWDLDKVPNHLRPTYVVVDESGSVIDQGKSIPTLKRELAPKVQENISIVAADIEIQGATTWVFGDIPRTFEREVNGRVINGSPGLHDDGGTVSLRVYSTEAEQESGMRSGTIALLTLNSNSPVSAYMRTLDQKSKLILAASPYPSVLDLLQDAQRTAMAAIVDQRPEGVWSHEEFDQLLETARTLGTTQFNGIVRATIGTLEEWRHVERLIKDSTSVALLDALSDVRQQVAHLIYPGFVSGTGAQNIVHLQRYFKAISKRLTDLPYAVERDRTLQWQATTMEREYADTMAKLSGAQRDSAAARAIRWLLEEYRVSLWAQGLGTAVTVSDKRIRKALEAL